jgi:hypothetical protein
VGGESGRGEWDIPAVNSVERRETMRTFCSSSPRLISKEPAKAKQEAAVSMPVCKSGLVRTCGGGGEGRRGGGGGGG